MQTTVANSIVAALIAALDVSPYLLTTTTCVVTDTPDLMPETNDNLMVTVTVGDGTFTMDVTGPGGAQVLEEFSIEVRVWSRMMLDRLEQNYSALTDTSRGLLTIKRIILKTLAGQQLFDTNANPLLQKYLQPDTSRHPPSAKDDDGWSMFGLSFLTQFEWDLS